MRLRAMPSGKERAPRRWAHDARGKCALRFALPHSQDDLFNVLADGCAKGGEALEPGDADMTLSNLAVEVLRHGLDRALPQNGSWIDALARGNHCVGATCRACVMAPSGVVHRISGDTGDLLVWWILDRDIAEAPSSSSPSRMTGLGG